MDFQYYINILLRRKWAILLTALLAAVLAYFLANSLPPKYSTTATLETGVLNYDGAGGSSEAYVQEYQINARFENLISQFRSEKMMRLESFRLLIHDLDESNVAFTTPTEKFENISPEDIKDLIDVLKEKLKSKDTALGALYDHNYSTLAKAYGYDHESMVKNLQVFRDGKTDFLKVQATSVSPTLAAFFVNNLCQDYIAIDSDSKYAEQDARIAQHEKDVIEAKIEFDSISNLVKNYMYRKGLTNTSQEGKLLVSNRTEMLNKQDEAIKNVNYLTSAIKSVKTKLNKVRETGRDGQKNATKSSSTIARIKREISTMTSEWVAGGRKDKKLGAKIRKLEEEKLLLIQSSASNFVSSNQTDSNQEEELERKLLNLEIQLKEASSAVDSYKSSVKTITGKIPLMANDRARIIAMESEKELMLEQYRDAQEDLRKANDGRTYQKVALKVIQNASIPEESKSNMALFVSAFSGVGAGALASILIFLLAFFDSKLSNTNQFKQLVKLPLLGSLPFVKKGLIPGKLFVEDDSRLMAFKESLRSIRYRLDESGEDVFLITSLRNNDGKSFAITYLVEALVANGKKVLVIDTNFRNNTLTGNVPRGAMHFGLILQNLISEYGLEHAFSLRHDDDESGQIAQYDLIGNNGGSRTPLEVLAGKNFGAFLEELMDLYDVIFLEGAPLAQYSDTMELEQFADKVIGVFASNASLNGRDKEAVTYLKSLGDKYLGSILNGIDSKNLN